MKIQEYAKKHKVSRTTIYRWIAEKRLKAKKILIERWDIEDIKVKKKPRYKLPPRYKLKVAQ